MSTPALNTIHPPAVKVGGRRLSLSSRPKHAAPIEPNRAEPSPPTAADYPRPVHTEGEDQHPPPPHHDDDVPPKKEKKHMNHDAEKQMRDIAQRRAEGTRPSKDLIGGHQRGFGAAGRIAQPQGKSLSF